jgi:hypothetical protein
LARRQPLRESAHSGCGAWHEEAERALGQDEKAVASLTMTALGVPPPDVLTERWFKAWTTELVVVAGIKIFRKDETTL